MTQHAPLAPRPLTTAWKSGSEAMGNAQSEAQAIYRAQQRFSGTELDLAVTPDGIHAIAERLGIEVDRVCVDRGWSGQVAYACLETASLSFSPRALWLPIVLHELAHLALGRAGHGPQFLEVFVRLIATCSSDELAEEFVTWMDDETVLATGAFSNLTVV